MYKFSRQSRISNTPPLYWKGNMKMKNKTIFFLEKICDRNMEAKDDVLLSISLNHDLFGTIKGYDDGKLYAYDGLIFEYRNQPGVALKSSTIISMDAIPAEGKLIITTRNSVYFLRSTKICGPAMETENEDYDAKTF